MIWLPRNPRLLALLLSGFAATSCRTPASASAVKEAPAASDSAIAVARQDLAQRRFAAFTADLKALLEGSTLGDQTYQAAMQLVGEAYQKNGSSAFLPDWALPSGLSVELVFGKQWRTAPGFGPRPYIMVRGGSAAPGTVTHILLTSPAGEATIDADVTADSGTRFQAEFDACDATLGQPCQIARTQALEWDGLYHLSLTLAGAGGQVVRLWVPVVGAFDPGHPTVTSPSSDEAFSGQPLLAWTGYTTSAFLSGVDAPTTLVRILFTPTQEIVWSKAVPGGALTQATPGSTPADLGAVLPSGAYLFYPLFLETRAFGALKVTREAGTSTHFTVQ